MKKILLVYKDQSFLERNLSLLSRTGLPVFTARTAREALKIHREERVSIIISGLDLPDMGGDTLCSLIRQDSALRSVSIILVCYPTPKSIDRAARSGANAWVMKPVQPNLLLEQVERFLQVATRRDLRVPFEAQVDGHSGPLTFTCLLRNISISGILCETDVRLNRDDEITISYPIDTCAVPTAGKIVRAENMSEGTYSYGVQFVGLAPEVREGIERFVAAQAA